MRLIATFIILLVLSGCATKQETRESALNNFFQSARSGDTKRIAYCIENGIAGINQQDARGLTALMHAFIGEKYDTVRALIDMGADLEIKDEYGETILYKVASRSCAARNKGEVLDILKLLLGRKARVDTKSKFGFTPAFSAAGDGFAERLRLLIDAGADINTAHRIMKGFLSSDGYIDGVSPLMYAARMGAVENIKVLVDAGAAIDAQAENGWTAVMFAIDSRNLLTAAILVRNAADIDTIRNDSGLTALEMGRQSRQEEMRAFFDALIGK